MSSTTLNSVKVENVLRTVTEFSTSSTHGNRDNSNLDALWLRCTISYSDCKHISLKIFSKKSLLYLYTQVININWLYKIKDKTWNFISCNYFLQTDIRNDLAINWIGKTRYFILSVVLCCPFHEFLWFYIHL